MGSSKWLNGWILALRARTEAMEVGNAKLANKASTEAGKGTWNVTKGQREASGTCIGTPESRALTT